MIVPANISLSELVRPSKRSNALEIARTEAKAAGLLVFSGIDGEVWLAGR